MRWYNIVSGIFLIMSIIYFALAAPVPVQKKHQAYVDAVHIPGDAIIVLGRRADGELEKLAEEFLKTSGKPIESSDAHVSSSLAPPGPDHGPTNVVQAPAPNQAPPIANPNPSMEPQSPSIEPQSPGLSDSDSYGWLFEPQGDEAHKPPPTQTSSGHGLALSPPGPDHGSTKVVQEPAPNPASSTADSNPLTESSSSSSTSSSKTLSDSEYKWLFEPEDGDKSHIPLDTPLQPNPKKRPWTAINSDPDFDWNYWYDRVNQPSPPKESGQASKYQHVERPDPVPSTALNLDLGLGLNPSPESPVPVSVVYPPFTFAGLPIKPEPDVVHPSFEITGLPTEHKQDVVHPPSTITESPTEPKHDEVDQPSTVTWSPIRPEHDVVDPPFTITGSPIPIEHEVLNRPPSSPDPEFHLDHQSLTTDSQPVDLLAAIYAAKGKGLESRRIFGTARDVGNVAQRELQPDDGRSLDPGELPPLAEPK